MSININRFVTRCEVPKRSAAGWQGVNQLVREEFVTECRRQLIPRLPERPEVVRIRRLAVRLRLTGEFDRQSVARAWARAFAFEMFAALKPLNSRGVEVVCAETRSEWLAKFISDLISGLAGTHWEYEEFHDVLQFGVSDGVLTVLQREPSEIVPVLLLLKANGHLDQLLGLLDDLALEELFVAIAQASREQAVELDIDQLLEIGALASSETRIHAGLANRRRALRLFLLLNRSRDTLLTGLWSPRLVFNALLTLDALIEHWRSGEPATLVRDLSPEVLGQRTGSPLHPVVAAFLARLRELAQQTNSEFETRKLRSLSQVLAELSPLSTVAAVEQTKKAYWTSSDWAGLLLLVGLLNRLGWPQRIMKSPLGATYGPRALTYCLIGLGLRMFGCSLETARLEPGLTLFAGGMQPDSMDLAGFRHFLASVSETEQLELVSALVGREENDTDAINGWAAKLDFLTSILIREFASRVRGFREASPSFVVKNFFAQPGRICISDEQILVILRSNPFHVALHMSGMDESIESVSWLGGRRLEFELEGL